MGQDWKKERGQDMPEGRVEVKSDFRDVGMPAIAQEAGSRKRACSAASARFIR